MELMLFGLVALWLWGVEMVRVGIVWLVMRQESVVEMWRYWAHPGQGITPFRREDGPAQIGHVLGWRAEVRFYVTGE